MKAVHCTAYGPPEVLKLVEVAKPVPEAGEVLVKVHAATVFTGDTELRAFRLNATWWLPARLMIGIVRPRHPIIGQELAGVVEAVGSGVTTFSAGDEIFAGVALRPGAYAEYRCIRADGVIGKKPANMSFEEAATVPIGGMNALDFIDKAALQRRESILINGAGGSIGTLAVQLARNVGAVVTVTDIADKLPVLKSLGAEHVIDFTKENFWEGGRIFDVILDICGKAPYGRSVDALKPGGRFVLANPTAVPVLRGLWTSRTSDKRVYAALASETPESLNRLKDLIEAGKLRTWIDRRFGLDNIVAAHTYVDTGAKVGNVVLKVAD